MTATTEISPVPELAGRTRGVASGIRIRYTSTPQGERWHHVDIVRATRKPSDGKLEMANLVQLGASTGQDVTPRAFEGPCVP